MKTMKFYKKIFLFKLRSGAKYTEAEHQQALMGLKRENRWHFYDFTVKGQAVTDNNLKDMLAGKLKIFFFQGKSWTNEERTRWSNFQGNLFFFLIIYRLKSNRSNFEFTWIFSDSWSS